MAGATAAVSTATGATLLTVTDGAVVETFALGPNTKANLFTASADANGKLLVTAVPAPPVLNQTASGTARQPALTGSGQAGATINLTIDGSAVAGTAIAVQPNGSWSFTPGTALSLGVHAVTAVQTVNGATSAVSNVDSFRVLPQAPFGLTDAAVAGGRVAAAANGPDQVLTGQADPGTSVTISDAGVTLGTTATSAAGTWTFPLGSLATGAHRLTAIATDAAGDQSPPSDPLAFSVDPSPPANAPVSSGPVVTFDQGLAFSTPRRVLFTGTITDPLGTQSLTLFDGDKSLGEATLAQDGTWSLDAPLTPGEHDAITAVATDAAGFTSTSEAPIGLVTGVRGEPWRTLEYDYDPAGQLYRETLTDGFGSVYFDTAVSTRDTGEIVYSSLGGTYFDDKPFFGGESVFLSDGETPASTTFDNRDGTHTVLGYADGQRLQALGFDMMTGGGNNETFVFTPRLGQETITDFNLAGPTHDVIELDDTRFRSVADILRHTVTVGQDAVISVGRFETITVLNTTAEALAQHPRDFRLGMPVG